MQLLPCCLLGTLIIASILFLTASGSCLRGNKPYPGTCVNKRKGSDEMCRRYRHPHCYYTNRTYNGTKSSDYTNNTCVKWNLTNPAYASFPHNFCRFIKREHAVTCYIKNGRHYKLSRCLVPCGLQDYKECGGNGIIHPDTIIDETDRFTCTHLFGVKWRPISITQNVSIPGNPEDCCQKCKEWKQFPCNAYTWSTGICNLYFRKHSLLATDINVEGAISGETCMNNTKMEVWDKLKQLEVERSAQCTYLPGIEIEKSTSDDTFNQSSIETLVGDCCGKCLKEQGCLGYTWTNGTCYLKASLAKFHKTKAYPAPVYVSGEVCGRGALSTPMVHLNEESDEEHNKAAWLGGIVAATIVLILLLMIFVMFVLAKIRRSRNLKQNPSDNQKESNNPSISAEVDAINQSDKPDVNIDEAYLAEPAGGELGHVPMQQHRRGHLDNNSEVTEGSEIKEEGAKAIFGTSVRASVRSSVRASVRSHRGDVVKFDSEYDIHEITINDSNRQGIYDLIEKEAEAKKSH